MSFSSIEFLFVFLPCFFLLYYLLPGQGKMLWLLVGSLVFYGWGCRETPWHLGLMAALTVVHYLLARSIRGRRGLLMFGLVLDFLLLFCFKYAAFAGNQLRMLLGLPGNLTAPPMPLGLSFFLFQAAAYLIDCYRGQQAESSLLRCGVFFFLFPHTASGPILRQSEMASQLQSPRVTVAGVDVGLREFCIGLGLKVLLADRIGKLWTDVGAIGFESISTPLAWMALIAYSLQLYLDFYGYSRMAVGLGLMLGLELPRNFLYPYTARSMTDFWRRWHMTLSRWFRDYLYIPLGGSREGFGRTVRNLLVVWLATGLWHGAGWNFLLWGFMLFLLLVLEKVGLRKVLEGVPLLGHLYMVLAIPLSWVPFAISELGQIPVFLSRLFPMGGEAAGVFAQDYLKYGSQYGWLLLLGILFSTPVPRRIYRQYAPKPWMPVVLVAIFLGCVYCIVRQGSDPFMYFQF